MRFTTLVICVLRYSAYVLSKLISSCPKYFKFCFPLKLFARYKMVNLSDLVGFALTLTARCKESRVELEGSFSTAQRQADFHADESPGFQIEHQIN